MWPPNIGWATNCISLSAFFPRAEKERNSVQQELDENQLLLQQDQADRANLEKNGKMLQAQVHDLQSRLDDLQRALAEADGAKRKLLVENCDLQHHAEEADREAARISKDRTSLGTQLDDAKRLADAESRVGGARLPDKPNQCPWRPSCSGDGGCSKVDFFFLFFAAAPGYEGP